MPLKQHPTDPDKMIYVSRQYDIPQLQGVTIVPQRTWVDLTHAEFAEILCDDKWQFRPELMLLRAQQLLKEKNGA